jgi:threonine aldolase
MRTAGWRFYQFIGSGGCRFMCAWDTTPEAVDAFAADLRAVAA